MKELSVDLQFINLKHAITHHIGNKHHGEEIKLAEMASIIKEESLENLISYFFKPIPWAEFYSFGMTDEDRGENKIYPEVKAVFENPENWIQHSKTIAQHLYDCGDHPQIKAGEFNFVYFENLSYDGETMSAIGIYKSTSRKPFLQMDRQERNYEIRHSLGYDLKSLDQACLILNTDEDEGYRVFCFDSTGQTSDARYWKDHFLDVKTCETEYHKTSAVMNLARNFVAERMEEDFELDRIDKIDLLNRSADYFKNREQFVKEDFEREVFADEGVIESFRDFNEQVAVQDKLVMQDRFDISEPAVKKQAKGFKSVLKLDKNFHIYIHGNRQLIEKGIDEESGKKFYKVFYYVEK